MRFHVVRQDTRRLDLPGSFAFLADATRPVRGHGVAAGVIFLGLRRKRTLTRTFSGFRPRIIAAVLRSGHTPCVGDQMVALSPATSATAQELPTEPCIW